MPYSKDKIMRNRWRNCPLRQKGLAMVEITDLKDMLWFVGADRIWKISFHVLSRQREGSGSGELWGNCRLATQLAKLAWGDSPRGERPKSGTDLGVPSHKEVDPLGGAVGEVQGCYGLVLVHSGIQVLSTFLSILPSLVAFILWVARSDACVLGKMKWKSHRPAFLRCCLFIQGENAFPTVLFLCLIV